ncbi:MAG: NUDIX hydrolase [Clostridia bacterium]|nr:NUDIX hydrolase [Clostridia bacterium]
MEFGNLREEIERFTPFNEQEEADKVFMIEFIDNNEDYLTRNNCVGHFSASNWIVNKDRTKVLMIYHNIYNSWAWTGGHADGEENLFNVALREATEESGIKKLKPLYNGIFSLEDLTVNGHIKRDKYVSSHLHLNCTFLFEASEEMELRIKEDENSNVQWIDIDKVVELVSEPHMRPIYQKLIDKVRNVID